MHDSCKAAWLGSALAITESLSRKADRNGKRLPCDDHGLVFLTSFPAATPGSAAERDPPAASLLDTFHAVLRPSSENGWLTGQNLIPCRTSRSYQTFAAVAEHLSGFLVAVQMLHKGWWPTMAFSSSCRLVCQCHCHCLQPYPCA